MRIILSALLGLLILFFEMTSTHGAPLPSWSVSVKAGAYQPGATGYAPQYGGPRGFLGEVEGSYKITPQLEADVSLGYFMQNGIVLSTSGRASSVTQQLILVPTRISLLYQFLFEENQLLVPYIGGGYTHLTYRHSVEGEETSIGGLNGYHARTGLKILLNRLDPYSANRLQADWGIAHTYFLFEGQYAGISNFGSSPVDLGGWTYLGGIQFEF